MAATRWRRRSACSGRCRRQWAHRIPFIVKLNHNELLTYPNKFDQIMFGTVKEAWNLGAVAVGATIYFGSDEADRQIQEVSVAFAQAHELGMATVLWCYLRNAAFKKDGVDYRVAADLTGQANHLGVTIEADIIKQKLPTTNGGYTALNFGKTAEAVYTKLTTDHPIDLCRYQVLNCYSGRVGLINSGGESIGAGDLAEAVRTAVINKRAGGTGLISGRKAFQRPMRDGVQLLNAVQDVYLQQRDHDRLAAGCGNADAWTTTRSLATATSDRRCSLSSSGSAERWRGSVRVWSRTSCASARRSRRRCRCWGSCATWRTWNAAGSGERSPTRTSMTAISSADDLDGEFDNVDAADVNEAFAVLVRGVRASRRDHLAPLPGRHRAAARRAGRCRCAGSSTT